MKTIIIIMTPGMNSCLCQSQTNDGVWTGLSLQFMGLLGRLRGCVVCNLSGEHGQFYYIWAHSRPQWFEGKTSLPNHSALPNVPRYSFLR